MKEIEKKMEKEIIRLMEELETKEPASDEYNKIFKELTELTDKTANLKRVGLERKKEEKENSFGKKVIEVCKIVVPIAGTFIGTVVCLRYDQIGVIPGTPIGRAFMNRIVKEM